MNNLKSIWSISDKDLIEAMKGEDRNSWQPCEKKDSRRYVCLQQNSIQKMPNTEYDSDHSETTSNSENFGLFAAIPKEFRPNKSTKNLLPVTSKNDNSVGRKFKESQSNDSKSCKDIYEGRKITDPAKEIENRFLASKDLRVSKSEEMKLKKKNQMKIKSDLNHETNPIMEETRSYGINKTHVGQLSKMPSKTSEKKGKTLREEFLEISFTRKTIHSSYDSETDKQVSGDSFKSLEKQLKACKFRKSKKLETEKSLDKHKTAEPNLKNELKKNIESYKTQNIKWNSNLCVSEKKVLEKKAFFRYNSTEENGEKNFTTAYWDCLKQSTDPCPSKRQNFINKTECSKEPVSKNHPGSKSRNAILKGGITRTEKTHIDTSAKPKQRAPRNRGRNTTTQIIKHEIRIVHVNESNKKGKCVDTISEKGSEKEQLYSDSASENEKHESMHKNLYWEGVNAKKIINSHINKFECNTKIAEKPFELRTTAVFIQKSPRLSTEKGAIRKEACSVPGQVLVSHIVDQENTFAPSVPETGNPDTHWNISSGNEQREFDLLIRYGRDISDSIAGSHMQIRVFLPFYHDWLILRNKTVQIFEQFAENILNRCEKNSKINDVSTLVSGGATAVATIPVPGWNWHLAAASKVIAALSSVLPKLFQTTPNLSDSGLTASQMIRHLQEDTELTSAVYKHAAQCDRQFQDACNLIAEFQQNINEGRFASLMGRPECVFLQDLKDFNPKSHSVYYKRLYKCFEELKKNPSSEVSKAFCGVFEGSSEEIGTIKQLQWRSSEQIGDSEAVKRAWDDICTFFQDSAPKCYKMLLHKIQNCRKALLKERCSLERDVKVLMEYKN